MCGIFAYMSKQQETSSGRSIIKTAINAIKHRGPDGEGMWISDDAKIGFGHVRLSIIDHDTGQQPFISECGQRVLIFNGEIYNYRELRNLLSEYKFRTNSDTEVVLKAFDKWGERCVERFIGMFSIVLWDGYKSELFVARDRFGIKPLYYYSDQKNLYICSEIKGILNFINTSVDLQGLQNYFIYQFNIQPQTLFKGIREFPPASYAKIHQSNHKIDIKNYWALEFKPDFSKDESWFIQKTRELFNDSIDYHIVGDVESGAYVSGGIDSTLVASLANERHGINKFFNGRFDLGMTFDESSYAQEFVTQTGNSLILESIVERDFVENIRDVIYHLDQPTAGPGSFPQYMVSKMASQHVKVVLGGQGGDEIFGGYTRYLVAYFEQCIKGAIDGTLNDGNFLVTYESIIPNLKTLKSYKPMIKTLFSDGLFEDKRLRYFALINKSNSFSDIILPEFLDQSIARQTFLEKFDDINLNGGSYFDQMTYFDFTTLLPALLTVEDRMSMAHGLEARVPFLYHPLVEFSATTPASIKFKNGDLKRLTKVAFNDKIPKNILRREDKMGFPVPLNNWLKSHGPAREFVLDNMLSQKAKQRFYLEKNLDFEKLLTSEGTFSRNIWALLNLELWQQIFIDY